MEPHPVDSVGVPAEPRSSGWRVLRAPWIDLFRPGEAGRCLSLASAVAFWVNYVLLTLLVAAALVLLALEADTVSTTVDWNQTTTLPAGYIHNQYVLVERSVSEVWENWHQRGPFGPAESMLLLVPLVVTFGAAFLAWLYLVDRHRAGAAWASYKRVFRAVTAAGGWVLVLVAGLGVVIVTLANNWDRRQAAEAAWPAPPAGLVLMVYGAVPAGLGLMLIWVGRAVRGALVPTPVIDFPPRCEGCGYDLTHIPGDGLCTECGVETLASLIPGARRRDPLWEQGRNWIHWCRTSWEVIVGPSRFYASLKLRTGGAALGRFVAGHYLTIALLAVVWTTIVVAGKEFVPGEIRLGVIVLALLGLLLVAWTAHRGIAALSMTWWWAEKALPDFAWARKVVAYESAFLWGPFLYNLGLATSFVIWGEWITELFGRQWVYSIARMPGEAAAVLFGNAAWGIVWLWRYRVALRAIRWSNF